MEITERGVAQRAAAAADRQKKNVAKKRKCRNRFELYSRKKQIGANKKM